MNSQATGSAKAPPKPATTFLFYLVGVTILLVLVSRVPFAELKEAVSSIGPEVLWLLLMPLSWTLPDAFSLWILLDRRVAFQDVVYTQVSGDGLNNITPLMGLGGEPYKAKHLSNFVSLEDASRTIIQSRLLHAASGVLFTAAVLFMTVALVDLEAYPKVFTAMGSVAVIMILSFCVILWATMSKVPLKVAGFVLTKLKIIKEFRDAQLSWSKLLPALLGKMVGRVGKFAELYFIFLLIDIVPRFGDVVLVAAMIMVSASVFFMVPQGLGVNEVGIAAAFNIIGMSTPVGLAYGLIRRARVVGYALLGLAAYLIGRTLRYGSRRYSPSV